MTKTMNKAKYLLAFLAAAILAVALSSVAWAAESQSHSITVTNTNTSISINGKTYSAYKLFDSTHQGDAYAYTMATTSKFYDAKLVNGAPEDNTLPAVLKNYFTFTAIPGDTSKVNVSAKDGFDARAFADAIQPFLANLSADKTAVASGESAVIALDADEAGQGYYIVTGDAAPTDPRGTENVVSAVIVTNEDPNPVAKPKAGIPTLDKKITGVTEDGALLDEEGQAAVAKVGSTVSYELDSIVPDLTGYSDYTFTFTDELSDGLDYVANSFELKIKGEVVEIAPVINGRSFTLTIPYNTFKATTTQGEGDNATTVAKYAAGDPIVLTYKATVNSAALTTDYENNTAKLTYSNNPYDLTTTNDTPDEKTYVVDINLDTLKVATGGETKLAGAEFKLFKEVAVPLENGEEGYNEDPEQNGTKTVKKFYKWADNKVTWVDTQDAGDTFTTNEQGNFIQQIRGLDKGTYNLLETKAPTGYNLLANPVTVVISATEADNQVTYSATFDDQAASVTNGVIDLANARNANQPVATGTIVNQSGQQLPSTGGMGTTILYIVGGIMVLVAVVFLITKRRVKSGRGGDDLM